MENTLYFALWVIPALVALFFVGYIFTRSYNTEVISLPKISPEKSRPKWLNQIKAAKRKILIVAGDLSKEVYNDTEVIDTFKRKLDDGIQIKVIFGPELSVDENGRNAFLDLFKLPNENILYSKKKRQPFHFRVIDGKLVYFERPHEINGPIRDVTIVDNSIMWSSRLAKLFNKIVEEEHLKPYDPGKREKPEPTEATEA